VANPTWLSFNMNKFDLTHLVPSHIQAFEAYYPSKPDQELMRLYGVAHLHRLSKYLPAEPVAL
jgi:hypothetical protein